MTEACDRLCTRQLLQKATTDAQRARKLADDAATTGLRQRKPGATNGTSDDVASPRGGVVTKGGKDQGVRRFGAALVHTGKSALVLTLVLLLCCQTFGLLHLIVCAIIFFVVGRYY